MDRSRAIARAAGQCRGSGLDGGLLVMGGTDGQSVSDKIFLLRWNGGCRKVETDTAFPRLPAESLLYPPRGSVIIFTIAGGQDGNDHPQQGFWRLDCRRKAAGSGSCYPHGPALRVPVR